MDSENQEQTSQSQSSMSQSESSDSSQVDGQTEPILPIGSHIGGKADYAELILRCNLSIIQMMFGVLPSKEQWREMRAALTKRKTQLVIHAPYTINLAQPPDSSLGKKSLATFIEQINFTSAITPEGKVSYIVVHVGKSLELDEKEAEKIFLKQMAQVLKSTPSNVVVLLETPAGQGTEMFTDLEHLFKVYAKLVKVAPHQGSTSFGLCIDTCHIFSAGHTIRDLLELEAVKQQPEAIRLIHLNDSQTPKGSGTDRHASIGTGFIFGKSHGGSLDSLELIVNWAVANSIPIVLETPSQFHQEEINTLYQIAYPERNILVEKWCEEMPDSGAEEESVYSQDDEEVIDDDGDEEEVIEDDQLVEGVSNNDRIIEILTILAQSTDNRFRKAALFKAIEVIRGLDFEITRKEEIVRYQGIGKGIGDKVHEILTTGTLKEYEEKKDEMDAIKNLSQISGIGPVTARNLYLKKGIKTIEELAESVRQKETKLTKAQTSGLKHHTDIKKRIPREEIDRFDKILGEICEEIDEKLRHIIVGSYRRKKPDSGDIDVLFRHPELVTTRDVHSSDMLEQIISEMESREMIDSILSQGKNKILMIAHLPGEDTSRRIDFLLTPTESHAASLLYFTGSKEFNLVTRRQAIRLGYRLNEYGLFDKKGQRIPTPTEQSIFDLLKFKYLQPEEREEVKRDGAKSQDKKSPPPKLKEGKVAPVGAKPLPKPKPKSKQQVRQQAQPQQVRQQQVRQQQVRQQDEEIVDEEIFDEEISPHEEATVRQRLVEEVSKLGVKNLELILDLSKKGDKKRADLIEKFKKIVTVELVPDKKERGKIMVDAVQYLKSR